MNTQVAITGGLAGGLAMVGVLYMAMWIMPRQMRMNMLLLVGTMFVPPGAAAYGIGLVVHMMMSAVFGVAHGALIEGVGASSGAAGAGYGALFGLGHVLLAGMALGMMPMLHPRMRSSQQRFSPALAAGPSGPNDEQLDAPGFFGLNYPFMTTVGFFALHIMFGVVVGSIYGAWA